MPSQLSLDADGRRQVLIVGMLDSVHLARWLSQFKAEKIDFVIMGSKKFRAPHPILLSLINASEAASFSFAYRFPIKNLIGYFDFFWFIFPAKISILGRRKRYLTKVIKKNHFDYIHALEIQGAGYLISELDSELFKKTGIIVTNWGSDIFYFKQDAQHVKRIQKTLACADYYSAECERDYKLASEFGFRGTELPCIPNAGGFKLADYPNSIDPAERKKIVVKAYGGQFGLGRLAVDVVQRLLLKDENLEVYFYSVTQDLLNEIESIATEHPARVSFSTTRNPIPRFELMKIFSESRVYLGCSKSDGISTSFLEALLTGVYPVQTQSSCANEWIFKGAKGAIVPPNADIILDEVTRALESAELVRGARTANQLIAETLLSENVIREVALTFYR
jgi:glycosyltransferase involved in cell wall biosynthesis